MRRTAEYGVVLGPGSVVVSAPVRQTVSVRSARDPARVVSACVAAFTWAEDRLPTDVRT
ncbi:hypothetical protein [Streptomyces sp. S.PNR 29]|uniref:hypothetical protein n=1 Tax=Streptomyces sp. S.PNR 29 TaxID=2973805 RepID=UPI0025B1CCA8|nr:hypothetical protein [Streptomyces sp. S.PNR 29]MDN0197559.1 hypothetical protein [Streptomyces sp. S.PNR 29]